MGTSAAIRILDENQEIARIYCQSDGYPDGYGVDLAEIVDKTIVNGIGVGMDEETHANGMSCLAATVVAKLKKRMGGIYLVAPVGETMDDFEYTYIVRSTGYGKKPKIEAYNYTDRIFTGSPKQFIAKYKEK